MKLDEIHFEVDDLEVSIKGIEAQALLRARIDHVTAIVDRVLATVERNPALLEFVRGRMPGQLAGAGESGAQHEDGDGGGPSAGGLTAGKLAMEAAKVVAKELGAAAGEEAKDLGLAATHKAAELGERRRHRRATRRNATNAALREAAATGVDLAEIDGSGVEGRITVTDVKEAVGES